MLTKDNQSKDGCDILMQSATPDIYRINAFRISGLRVDATTREISNQIQKNQMLEKYGGKFDNNKSPFPIDPPPDNYKLQQALHRLRDPETRIIDEFFWFWPHSLDSSIKDHALEALSKNDIKTAENLWINYEASLTESNVSRHNLAVLSHLMVLDMELQNGKASTENEIKIKDKYWKDTFKRWRLLLEHEGFWSRLTARVRQMNDPRLTTGFVKRLREALPHAILQISASLALKSAEAGNKSEAKRYTSIMNDSGFSKDVISTTLQSIAKPLRTRIKIMCRSFSEEIYLDKKSELIAVKKLLEQAMPLLNTLHLLLPKNDIIKESAYDEVALAGSSLAISYANATEDWEAVLPIFEELKKIAIGESATKRVGENYDIFKKNVEYDNLYKRCFYCKSNTADNTAVVEVKMHGDVQKNYYTNQITWRYLTAKVPRCNECKKQHNVVNNYTGIIGLIGIILGIITWVKIDEGVGFFVFAAIAVVGFSIGWLIGDSKCKTLKHNHYKEFPQIKELIKQGWTWGERPNTN